MSERWRVEVGRDEVGAVNDRGEKAYEVGISVQSKTSAGMGRSRLECRKGRVKRGRTRKSEGEAVGPVFWRGLGGAVQPLEVEGDGVQFVQRVTSFGARRS
jgi:hypothetical protein